MYSQNDLDEAVASDAISAEAAASLRAYVDSQRASPAVDEENFRLISGFNDIFVSIASAILLLAVGWIGQSVGQSLGLVVEVDGAHHRPRRRAGERRDRDLRRFGCIVLRLDAELLLRDLTRADPCSDRRETTPSVRSRIGCRRSAAMPVGVADFV